MLIFADSTQASRATVGSRLRLRPDASGPYATDGYMDATVTEVLSDPPNSVRINIDFIYNPNSFGAWGAWFIYLAPLKGATGPAGGFGSSASYYSTVDQTGTVNSIQSMTLNNTDWQSGISLQNSSQIRMTNAGKYNIAFSAQLHQTSSSGIVNIWLSKNGTPVNDSNTKVAITANSPYIVAAWNFFVNATAGDYYEIVWSSDSANTVIETEASTGSGATLHPAIPSVILTVNQVG
jgi:hypothetical protein